MEGLRVDLHVIGDESFHLRGDFPLDLQLLDVGDVPREGVLAEEVADEDLLDVRLLVEARILLRLRRGQLL